MFIQEKDCSLSLHFFLLSSIYCQTFYGLFPQGQLEKMSLQIWSSLQQYDSSEVGDGNFKMLKYPNPYIFCWHCIKCLGCLPPLFSSSVRSCTVFTYSQHAVFLSRLHCCSRWNRTCPHNAHLNPESLFSKFTVSSIKPDCISWLLCPAVFLCPRSTDRAASEFSASAAIWPECVSCAVICSSKWFNT